MICVGAALGWLQVFCGRISAAQVPVVAVSNLTFRVVAANVTSGNNQRYEGPGQRILRGLKPDVVAIQEFNYASTNGRGIDTPAAIREFVDGVFGTNFSYYREPYTAPGNIPNGIISRWPIVASGSWSDGVVSNRGFAWARIRLPGTNDLCIVSVHLYSSGSEADRKEEAVSIRNHIIGDPVNFPSSAFVVVGGDFNTNDRFEDAVTEFKKFLSDAPIPTDTTGDPDTNSTRNKPYDYLLPSFNMTNRQIPVVIGSRSFLNGLVFVSTNYTPLADVSPVQYSDSLAFQMQHMAVVKDFRISFPVTNYVNVSSPSLTVVSNRLIRWTGPSNVTYGIEVCTNLSASWSRSATVSSATTNFSYPMTNNAAVRRFHRVVCP